MRATTRAANVDRFMKNPRKSDRTLFCRLCKHCGVWTSARECSSVWRAYHGFRWRCGKAMLEWTGQCVLSANDVAPSDQAGRRRRRPRAYEEGPGGTAPAAPPDAALAALGLYSQHPAALRGAF